MAAIDKPRKLLLPDTNYPGSLIPDLQPPAFSSLSAMGSGALLWQPHQTDTTPQLEELEGPTQSCPTNKCLGGRMGLRQSSSEATQ